MIMWLSVMSAALWLVSSGLWVWSALLSTPIMKVQLPVVIEAADDDILLGGVSWNKIANYFQKQSAINATAALSSALAALPAALLAANIYFKWWA